MVRVTGRLPYYQLYVRGHRIHHAIAGVVVAVPCLFFDHLVIGAALALLCVMHDWDDRRVWISDLRRRRL